MMEALVLSIGTTHPRNIAGIGLDLRLAADLDVNIATVVTAVSAQDERGLHAIETLSPEIVRSQRESLRRIKVGAVRVGALTSPRNVRIVAEYVRALGVPAVVDPVIAATHGGTFADDETVDAIRSALASLPNVILTPNLAEACRLLGLNAVEREKMGDAARALREFGARAVLLKGGHLEGDPLDILADERGMTSFCEPRIAGTMRGTGCALAFAIAAALARGYELREAVPRARAFVRARIAACVAASA
jgi:hydroxymethylpyrimidine/phosphomethylpyrimidine kinase